MHVTLCTPGFATATRVRFAPSTGPQISNAQHHEHQTDDELHRETKPRSDDPVEQDDCSADQNNRDGVADTPPHADPCCKAHMPLAPDRRRDSGDVISIGRVAHAEQKSERDRRADRHSNYRFRNKSWIWIWSCQRGAKSGRATLYKP